MHDPFVRPPTLCRFRRLRETAWAVNVALPPRLGCELMVLSAEENGTLYQPRDINRTSSISNSKVSINSINGFSSSRKHH